MQLLDELFFKMVLGAEWVWYRYEYQNRGSSHSHGFLKIKEPGPGIHNMGKRLKEIDHNVNKMKRKLKKIEKFLKKETIIEETKKTEDVGAKLQDLVVLQQ